MSASLVGSEMCIRDRSRTVVRRGRPQCPSPGRGRARPAGGASRYAGGPACLLYTSDAADDM
eukprot:8719739-Alexandrium_andersonii.AAC.1